MRGKVKWWIDSSGQGSVTSSEGEDLSMNRSSIVGRGRVTLVPGDEVVFERATSVWPKVVNVRLVPDEGVEMAPGLVTSFLETGSMGKLADDMIEEGLKHGASQISIEPHRNIGIVRFRIENKLYDALHPLKWIALIMTERIKELAGMDRGASTWVSQTGRFHHPFQGQTAEIRARTEPTYLGEKIVLRILHQRTKNGLTEIPKIQQQKDVSVNPLRPLRVFLCHASNDKPRVRRLYSRLITEAGIDPWLDDRRILPGQDWDYEITNAVRSSDLVIVCLSRASISKVGYIQKEIKFALDVADEQPEGALFILPVKLEDCEIPSRLRRWQYVDYFRPSGYRRLQDALKFRLATISVTIPGTANPETAGYPSRS